MPTDSASVVGLCALNNARKYLGIKEQPAGSNRGPLIDQWNLDAGAPLGSKWCMSFAHGMFKKCGKILGGYASVGFFEQWAAQHGYLVRRPFAGDLVCYEFDSDSWPDHVGIVERVLALRWRGAAFAGYVRTIEGNTAVGNDSNGGEVMRRWRWIRRAQFARIPS